MHISQPDYIQAHQHSIRNRAEILASDYCGCFYCLSVFPPSAVEEWVEETDGSWTALCPKCGIDSVIGSESGFPVNEQFLGKMEAHWFRA
jgi:hypothetical protein